MMPQSGKDRTPQEALDWRAEPDDDNSQLRDPWRVVDPIGRVIADRITEDMARLIAAAPAKAALYEELADAARDIIRLWGLTGDAFVDFEDVASWFQEETGMLRPGKDCLLHSAEDRKRRYDRWVEGKRETLRNMANQAGRTPG